MRVFIVYKEQSDHAREVRDYLRDFEHRNGKKLEEVNPETREGSLLCEIYEVMEYPTIVAVNDDGVLQTMWRGSPLPVMDEVSYYVQ